jgi:hypothetical protein
MPTPPTSTQKKNKKSEIQYEVLNNKNGMTIAYVNCQNDFDKKFLLI